MMRLFVNRQRAFVYVGCLIATALLFVFNLTGCDRSEEEAKAEVTELIPVSQLRMVSLHFMSGSISKHVVHESQVDVMVEASLKLHHEPGVNPHNGKETAKLREIFLWKLQRSGPYWWTGPSLHAGDKKGAAVYDWQIFYQLWPERKEPLPRGW
jgi:hypothetical protein